MPGIARPATPFTLGIDSDNAIVEDQLRAMRDDPLTPIRWMAIYLGAADAAQKRDAAFSLGIDVLLVSFGKGEHWVPKDGEGSIDGAVDVRHAMSLGAVPTVDIFTDFELGGGTAAQSIDYLNDRGAAQKSGGYGPGLYVGAGTPLNGAQLGGLVQSRYWQALSRLALPGVSGGMVIEPTPGWCVRQLPHTVTFHGVPVDFSVICFDWAGRVPILWSAGKS